MTKAEKVILEAEAHMGCPYVYGTWGQLCTPALRRRYAAYNPESREKTYGRCQVLRDNDPKPNCEGCKYKGMLAFDCRGFTHYCVEHGAGIDISGGFVGRQWTDHNWDVKGNVSDMIEAVSCVFVDDMSHTGLYVLDGRVIHCSGEVKTDTLTGGRKWAKFGIPRGLYTWQELARLVKGDFKRMLKKGMSGADVRNMQIMLNALGYDCGTVDGIYGAKTVEAVKAFQRAEGLTVDGIAGMETLAVLALKASAEQTPEKPSETPSDAPQKDDDKTYVLVDRDDLLALADRLAGIVTTIRGWANV